MLKKHRVNVSRVILRAWKGFLVKLAFGLGLKVGGTNSTYYTWHLKSSDRIDMEEMF